MGKVNLVVEVEVNGEFCGACEIGRLDPMSNYCPAHRAFRTGGDWMNPDRYLRVQACIDAEIKHETKTLAPPDRDSSGGVTIPKRCETRQVRAELPTMPEGWRFSQKHGKAGNP